MQLDALTGKDDDGRVGWLDRGAYLSPTLAAPVAERLFQNAGASRWGLSRGDFAEMLEASSRHGFRDTTPSPGELERYLARLHLEDLALAGACARGNGAAWDHFVLKHRPVLYRAADALDPGGGARDLADALYAELYGLSPSGGERRSLFRYFHGRSSLATWLRAVLAQRHVDALRARRRVVALEEDEEAAPAARSSDPDPDRERLVPLVEAALTTAIEGLAPRERLRLRAYYVMQLTLAQIGRLTGEHEATVSRQLARTRAVVRGTLERVLLDRAGLSTSEVGRAVELALENPGALDLERAFDRKTTAQDRST